MGATQIPTGSPLARKVFGIGLFAGVQQAPGFMNMLSGPMPQQGEAEAKLKGQTAPGMPIVKSTDLTKTAGETVSVDLFNILQGKPVMGDKRLAGRLMSLSSSSMDIKINQYRGGADPGGKMSQQRTVHNLRGVAMAGLRQWATRLEDQICLVHFSGARGSQNTSDWVVPLASDADFAEIMVNSVTAPTFNRHFYAGDATALDNLDSSDILDLPTIDRVSTSIMEGEVPMQPVQVPGDDQAWGDPLWVLWVSDRVWLYLQTRTGEKAWRTFLQNAYDRKSGSKPHPLFNGKRMGMWSNILVKVMPRWAIRFAAGDTVTVATSAASFTTESKTAAVPTDRALLVGAQALGKVYGKHGASNYHYSWNEESVDHGNSVEISMAAMGGCAKIRFKPLVSSVPTDTDHGVAVIDSYAPDPNTSAGKALL
jgi:N4-gp56 family major capsid protein